MHCTAVSLCRVVNSRSVTVTVAVQSVADIWRSITPSALSFQSHIFSTNPSHLNRLLVVPRFQKVTCGAFTVAGLMTRNLLCDDLCDPDLSTDSFRCTLKMFLFEQHSMHSGHQRHCVTMCYTDRHLQLHSCTLWTAFTLIFLFLVRFFAFTFFCLISCSRLSWLHVSFWLHVK